MLGNRFGNHLLVLLVLLLDYSLEVPHTRFVLRHVLRIFREARITLPQVIAQFVHHALLIALRYQFFNFQLWVRTSCQASIALLVCWKLGVLLLIPWLRSGVEILFESLCFLLGWHAVCLGNALRLWIGPCSTIFLQVAQPRDLLVDQVIE